MKNKDSPKPEIKSKKLEIPEYNEKDFNFTIGDVVHLTKQSLKYVSSQIKGTVVKLDYPYIIIKIKGQTDNSNYHGRHFEKIKK